MEYISILWQSLNITLFVISMMLIIDYLNVFTRGIWSESLQRNQWKQVLLGAALGLIPGCLGAYTAVSLYVHNIFGLGAVVAAMIATSGDEAFFMFSIIPQTALLIMLILFGIALLAGFMVNVFIDKKKGNSEIRHFHIHEGEPDIEKFWGAKPFSNLKKISNLRLILIGVLVASLIIIAFNFNNLLHGLITHDPNDDHAHHFHPVWVGVTFTVVIGLSLLIVLTVSDHFLKEHLVNHIIRKHFVRVFLWIFGTLIVMHFITGQFNVADLITENLWVVLVVALVVGIIPESGPHFVFVILFASGSLPLSILLANSIVQDGHGSLPLLAESQKGFLKVKAINILVGGLVGVAGLLLGF